MRPAYGPPPVVTRPGRGGGKQKVNVRVRAMAPDTAVLILTSVRRTAPIAATLTVTAGLLLAACGGGSAPPANLISVSNGGCGGGWHVAKPGPYTFQIYN